MSIEQYEISKIWNIENYNQFLNYLISLQDQKYKKFHSSLVLNSKYEMIGIRVPIMREVAKNIAKAVNIPEISMIIIVHHV